MGEDAARGGHPDDRAGAGIAAPGVRHDLADVDHQIGFDETPVVLDHAAARGLAQVLQSGRFEAVVVDDLPARPETGEDLLADEGPQLRLAPLLVVAVRADEHDVVAGDPAREQQLDHRGQDHMPRLRRAGGVVEADRDLHAGLRELGERRRAVGACERIGQRSGRGCERLGILELRDDRVLRHLDGNAVRAVVDVDGLAGHGSGFRCRTVALRLQVSDDEHDSRPGDRGEYRPRIGGRIAPMRLAGQARGVEKDRSGVANAKAAAVANREPRFRRRSPMGRSAKSAVHGCPRQKALLIER